MKSARPSLSDYTHLQEVQRIPGRESLEAEGEGHCDVVLAVAAHPKANAFASGGLSKDKEIKIWGDDPGK